GFPLSLDTTKACVFVRDFKDSDIYAIEELAVLPTHTITTWHYLQSQKEDGEGMLCGYLLYVVKKDSKIKLVSRPPSEVGAKATQKGDDFRRLKGIIDKYCEDKTKELPGTLKKLLSQEKDKEFVERAIVNFFYMGKNKSLEKDAGAIVAYNLHVPKSSYASKKSATAIKLGDENMWFIKEEELPKELRGD
ncbi:MAG: hypothetical protein KAR47_00045, partial [Planctomycetes bacterium]|nr:hypothetical protein [Planctomycetota bacterium]